MCFFHIELNSTDTKILTVLGVRKLPPFPRFLGSTHPARICEMDLTAATSCWIQPSESRDGEMNKIQCLKPGQIMHNAPQKSSDIL